MLFPFAFIRVHLRLTPWPLPRCRKRGSEMSAALNRRRFLSSTAGAGALAVVGDLSFLSALRPLRADEVAVWPEHVRLRPEIEPLVRLVEETPRERLVERIAEEIRRGTGYRQVLAALMLAGVRNIKPRPVGF